jgi:hypothetical protein
MEYATESRSALHAVFHKVATPRQIRIAKFGWDQAVLKLLDTKKLTLTQAEFLSGMNPNKKPEALSRIQGGEKAGDVLKDYVGRRRGKSRRPETLVDGNGTEVPKRLIEAFVGEEANALAREIRKWASAIRSVEVAAKKAATPWTNTSRIVSLVEQAKQSLTLAAGLLVESLPWLLCSLCENKGCDVCRGCGWVPQWRSKEMQAEKGDSDGESAN